MLKFSLQRPPAAPAAVVGGETFYCFINVPHLFDALGSLHYHSRSLFPQPLNVFVCVMLMGL